jgi:glycerol-1-phosphate dehydrogenase [NAD(P)+]
MYGLLMSGIAMQLLGNSRCASGAEHHISHLIEMRPEPLGLSSDALHGEKVGVGSLIAIAEYHRIAGLSDVEFCDYPAISEEYIRSIFGDRLSESIINENARDAAAGVTKQILEKNFDGIRAIINDIPTVDELLSVYKSIGAISTLSEIGVNEDRKQELVDYSPLVRNRITLMRLRRAMKNI